MHKILKIESFAQFHVPVEELTQKYKQEAPWGSLQKITIRTNPNRDRNSQWSKVKRLLHRTTFWLTFCNLASTGPM